jgi:hypothetical protein
MLTAVAARSSAPARAPQRPPTTTPSLRRRASRRCSLQRCSRFHALPRPAAGSTAAAAADSTAASGTWWNSCGMSPAAARTRCSRIGLVTSFPMHFESLTCSIAKVTAFSAHTFSAAEGMYSPRRCRIQYIYGIRYTTVHYGTVPDERSDSDSGLSGGKCLAHRDPRRLAVPAREAQQLSGLSRQICKRVPSGAPVEGRHQVGCVPASDGPYGGPLVQRFERLHDPVF